MGKAGSADRRLTTKQHHGLLRLSRAWRPTRNGAGNWMRSAKPWMRRRSPFQRSGGGTDNADAGRIAWTSQSSPRPSNIGFKQQSSEANLLPKLSPNFRKSPQPGITHDAPVFIGFRLPKFPNQFSVLM